MSSSTPDHFAAEAATSFEPLDWVETARRHAQPHRGRSSLQLIVTLLVLALLWITMMLTLEYGYWLTLILSIPAAALTVRLFVIQHDCGHRSFFRSRRSNDLLGQLIGILTLTPHAYWRRAHNIHHATCGDLNNRGIGDLHILTVAEYTARSPLKRLGYRIYRNPITLFLIGPVYLFVIKYRLPLDLIRRYPSLLLSVMVTNIGIAAAVTGLSLGFGFVDFVMVHAPIIVMSCIGGVWLFYVQHQFEYTYWRRAENWQFHDAAVFASSFYDMPRPIQWLFGNIGIHHIHHLCSRIPNYRLRECLADIPALQSVNRIGLSESFKNVRLALWDEVAQKMISFKALREQHHTI